MLHKCDYDERFSKLKHTNKKDDNNVIQLKMMLLSSFLSTLCEESKHWKKKFPSFLRSHYFNLKNISIHELCSYDNDDVAEKKEFSCFLFFMYDANVRGRNPLRVMIVLVLWFHNVN